MKEKVQCFLVGLVLLGITVSVVAACPWMAAPVLAVWIVVNERRIRMASTANPAPPQVSLPSSERKPQVTRSAGGALVTVLPHSIRHSTGLQLPYETGAYETSRGRDKDQD